jgi:hypothetical protein
LEHFTEQDEAGRWRLAWRAMRPELDCGEHDRVGSQPSLWALPRQLQGAEFAANDGGRSSWRAWLSCRAELATRGRQQLACANLEGQDIVKKDELEAWLRRGKLWWDRLVMASSAMSFRPNSVLGLVREGASCSIRPSAHQDGSDLPELRGCQASTMGTRPAWTRLGGEPPQWGWHHWARGRPSSTMWLRRAGASHVLLG